MAAFAQQRVIRERLSAETGTLRKQGGDLRVALVYPSPYRVGMSSLGYQSIYRVINRDSPHRAERSFLPDGDIQGALLTYESELPVGDFDVFAVSLAYELELTGLMSCLELAGMAPFARDRSDRDPLVVLGGPLTFSNPLPAAPFADIIIMGEGESLILDVLDEISGATSRAALLARLGEIHGVYVPVVHGEVLRPVAAASDALLPAFSQIITPNTELSNMHLVEAERGCHRRCSFCVMRRSTNGGMRTAPIERVLETIPEHAERVGLVGAAVTDHPDLTELVTRIVDGGRGIGISSLRADRLTPELVNKLREGGYRTLTVASDGASERLRKVLLKSIKAHHLRHAARLAADANMRFLKLYMMLGVPEEEDADLDELVDFSLELAAIGPIAMTLSPFVAKRNTPLDQSDFAGVDVVDHRIALLKKALGRKVDLRSTSAKWAWVEYCLAQGGFEMADAVVAARNAGGGFSAWRKAIERHAPRFMDHLYRGKRRRSARGSAVATS